MILSWIGGAEFEGGGPPATGGDTDTDTDTGGTDTTGEPAEPTFANVQAIIDAGCSCALPRRAPPTACSRCRWATRTGRWSGSSRRRPTSTWSRPGDPAASYLYLKSWPAALKKAGGAGTLMPPVMGLMDDAKIGLVEAAPPRGR